MPLSSLVSYPNKEDSDESNCHGQESNSSLSNALSGSVEIQQGSIAENPSTIVQPFPSSVAILAIPRPPPTRIVASVACAWKLTLLM